MPDIVINWWAVIVAAAVNMIVGAVWYSPVLFAKDWAKLVGRKMDQMGDGTNSYIITTIAALVQSAIFAFIVGWSGAHTVAQGAYLGLLIWIAFVAITQGVNTVFAVSRKKLWAINTGYFLVVLVINGAILAAWR